MKFQTNRNITVTSRRVGRSIRFAKDVLTYVPRNMWPEVLAVGAVPESELPAPEELKTPAAPDDPDERKDLAVVAFEAIVEAGERESFTTAGAPTIEAITATSNLVLSAAERDTFWDEYRQEKAKREATETDAESKDNTE